jgi:nucleotide-binding universal stress UspA family protein
MTKDPDTGRTGRPIIAALDPRRHDFAPAALGILLARLTRARLILAGAYPVDLHVDRLYPEYTRAARVDAERAMRHVAALLEQVPGKHVPVTTRAVPAAGISARALHDLAEGEEASLLVIGSSPRGHAARVLPGAVTDRLLNGAPCPVAVASASFSFRDIAEGARLIGVAFTDTPDGRAALITACTLAARAHGLVRVLTVTESSDRLMTGTLDDVTLQDIARTRHDAAEAVLRRGLAGVPAGASAGGEILSGDPADALVAASVDLELLVCGSRGYGPVRTLLLGGTSHALVRKAACPVVVVPPGSPLHDSERSGSDARAVEA